MANHSEATDFMCDGCGKKCNIENNIEHHGKKMHKEGGSVACPDCQGIPGDQDLKGQPPTSHLEVLTQWNIPGRDSPVEDKGQGIPGVQDLKG